MNIKADKLHLINFVNLALVVMFSAMGNHTYGQGRNEEVTIIAPYIPSVGDAVKIPFRPDITPPETSAPVFEYQYVTKSLETRIEPEAVDPVRVSEGKEEELFRNYAKAGFGNYWTPYVEFLASSLRSEKYHLGARLKHHSSQGGAEGYGPNGFSHNLVSLFGRTFMENHTLSGNLSYNRDVVHFYGYQTDSFPALDIAEEDIRQRFQLVKAVMEFGSNYTSGNKLDHLFRLEYHYFNDIYQARESYISFNTSLNKGLSMRGSNYQHAIGLDMKVDYLNFKDSLAEFTPLYIEIKPVYHFSIGQYSFKAGVHVDIVNETSISDNGMTVEAFPTLGAELVIIENQLKVFADLSGELTINTFSRLTEMNPFITSTPTLISTDEHIKFRGGITGNAGGMNFLAEASYAYVTDMPLFVTDTSLFLENKFLIIYDDLNILNIKGSLGYSRISNLRTRLTASYFHYITKNEEKAWQMPSAEISLDASYLLKEKFTFRAAILFIGTRYALTFNEELAVEPVKMNAAFDLSVGFEYRITPKISAFIDGNNLLNSQYQRWYNYPVQGIQAMLGAKFSF